MEKSFEVRVAPKDSNHIFYNKGSKQAFTFDNEKNKTLKLVRGNTYTFNVDTPTHPFYFTSSSVGSSKDTTTLMGPNEHRTDHGTVSFTVRDDLPSNFYYQCGNHSYMGGPVIVIEQNDLINLLTN